MRLIELAKTRIQQRQITTQLENSRTNCNKEVIRFYGFGTNKSTSAKRTESQITTTDSELLHDQFIPIIEGSYRLIQWFAILQYFLRGDPG